MKTAAILTGFIMFLLLTGCPYESKYTLSDPKDSPMDTTLIGRWASESDTLVFFRFSAHEYYIEFRGRMGKTSLSRYRGFITMIHNLTILNFADLDEPDNFYFARIRHDGDKIKIDFASDEFIKTKFVNSHQLKAFFDLNYTNKSFFEEEKEFSLVKNP